MTIFRTARVAPEKRLHRPPAVAIHAVVEGDDMAKLTYKEQLLHPNWQRKRLEVLERAEFKCESCYDGESTLHVHHKRYLKGRMAWEYEHNELMALCVSCHEEHHANGDILNEVLASVPSDGPGCLPEVVGLVSGFLGDGIGESVDPWAYQAGQVAKDLNAMSGLTIYDLINLSTALADCSKSFVPLLRKAIEDAEPDR